MSIYVRIWLALVINVKTIGTEMAVTIHWTGLLD